MSTRKDVQAAADAIKDARPDHDIAGVVPRAEARGINFACDQIAKSLADSCAADNPRFKRKLFLEAAGVDESRPKYRGFPGD